MWHTPFCFYEPSCIISPTWFGVVACLTKLWKPEFRFHIRYRCCLEVVVVLLLPPRLYSMLPVHAVCFLSYFLVFPLYLLPSPENHTISPISLSLMFSRISGSGS